MCITHFLFFSQVFLFGAGGGGGETNSLGAKGGRHDGKSSGGGGGFTSTCLRAVHDVLSFCTYLCSVVNVDVCRFYMHCVDAAVC